MFKKIGTIMLFLVTVFIFLPSPASSNELPWEVIFQQPVIILDINAAGDWADLDPVEGGPGGIWTYHTDIDSLTANPTYTEWTSKLSIADGHSTSNSENQVMVGVYFNANSTNDSLRVTVWGYTKWDTLSYVCDTLGFIVGAADPVLNLYRLSLSAWAREYRFKFESYTSGGGTANARGNDVQIFVYWPNQDYFEGYRENFKKPFSK